MIAFSTKKLIDFMSRFRLKTLNVRLPKHTTSASVIDNRLISTMLKHWLRLQCCYTIRTAADQRKLMVPWHIMRWPAEQHDEHATDQVNCDTDEITRKPCCRRETARCRSKFWSIPSPLALCWSNISQSNAVSQWMYRVCVNTVCLKKQKNMYY